MGLVFWGTNQWSDYNWTGGSILRQQWLVASVIGLCLLQKQKLVAAGATITYAALLSIFPGFLALGVGLKAIADGWQKRRFALSQEHQRLMLGALLALAVLVPPSAYVAGGLDAWLAFVANSRADSQPAPNDMGLPTLLSYDDDTLRLRMLGADAEPVRSWSEARQQTLAERRPWQVALIGGLLVLVTAAARRQPEWVLAILGLGFVVFGFQLSNYYYVLLLPFALLWPRHRSVGIGLIATALASHWLRERWLDDEEFYTRSSAVAVGFVVYAAAVVRFARTPPAQAAAPQTPA